MELAPKIFGRQNRLLRSRTDVSKTHRWREMDSNPRPFTHNQAFLRLAPSVAANLHPYSSSHDSLLERDQFEPPVPRQTG